MVVSPTPGRTSTQAMGLSPGWAARGGVGQPDPHLQLFLLPHGARPARHGVRRRTRRGRARGRARPPRLRRRRRWAAGGGVGWGAGMILLRRAAAGAARPSGRACGEDANGPRRRATITSCETLVCFGLPARRDAPDDACGTLIAASARKGPRTYAPFSLPRWRFRNFHPVQTVRGSRRSAARAGSHLFCPRKGVLCLIEKVNQWIRNAPGVRGAALPVYHLSCRFARGYVSDWCILEWREGWLARRFRCVAEALRKCFDSGCLRFLSR